MKYFTVKGHSGCEVFISSGNVIKRASDKQYSSRLEKQFRKQKVFDNKFFKTPKIYKSETTDGIFWFEMELVNYKTFDEFMLTASKRDLDVVSEKIIQFIDNNCIEDVEISVDVTLINKFERTKNLIFVKHGIDVSFLNEFFYDLEEKITIPGGYCHGDLTFSNMLFHQDDVVLIDFLDTFLETP